MKPKGTVYLVGAGPGNAGLLTLRAAELLARADVVACDGPINSDVLTLAPQSAEIINGSRRATLAMPASNELVQLLISRARAGKTVVRLIGGDPFFFGGGGEEAEQLADAHIPFEVVPGVSSLVAGPNYAGVPLTHRQFASQLTLVAGHEDSAQSGIDWAQVAKTPGTKVIMLGKNPVGPIAESLVGHGLAPDTPVAVVGRGSTDLEQSVEGTLATIASLAAREKIGPPAMLVIGDVVKLRDKLNWFERRPLFGQRIVVSRAREQAGQLSRRLQELGAEVMEVPTIKLDPPTRRQNLVDALLELNAYDWLVFTSPNGVTKFFEYFFKQFHDMRDLGGARIAAVGPATAGKLKDLHLQVDLMPDEALGSEIAKAFAKFESIENLKICLLRAEVANRELPEALEQLGAIVDDIACYQTVPDTEDTTGAAASLLAIGADWVLFTSGSTVRNFHARFDLPALLRKFPQLKTAAIGPETSKALAELGLTPTLEAKHHTLDGLITTLLAAQK
ncbi:MAG TPA: uroporphyrinogen-III C-methyltransferase [Candidatus Paceibacterota bacterium]|nr:uroporphyrinogen-III C-methyltransferase [Verrucomicrobiota bacterium]HSA09657.1 uroporphyrinogen-III C-methyltransferase [Candidatus Paceibacterota bacterium]